MNKLRARLVGIRKKQPDLVSREHFEFVECPARSYEAEEVSRTSSFGVGSSGMERKRWQSEQWNDKRNWNNNDGQQQQQQPQQSASSSSQPSVRMASQARENEDVRRVMQESTATIEEIEDEVVDLIGMFNSCARSSNMNGEREACTFQDDAVISE